MHCQHPGKILLQQYMEPQKVSQNHLARAIKVPPRRINEIVHGKRSITADTAVRLAIYFGNSANYWMHLQAEFEIEKITVKDSDIDIYNLMSEGQLKEIEDLCLRFVDE